MLAATFVFAGLWGYAHGRSLLAQGRRRTAYVWMSLSLALGTLLAVLSKENGALLPVLAWVLEALVFDRVCVDTMSGMTHPNTVEVRWQDRVLRGCGGDPARLLQGEPWEVVELDGRAVADPARITLGFAAVGRLAGSAACNRYFGSYVLSGEGLRLSPLGATKMACESRAMEEERRFMVAAATVSGFAIATDGGLELRAEPLDDPEELWVHELVGATVPTE